MKKTCESLAYSKVWQSEFLFVSFFVIQRIPTVFILKSYLLRDNILLLTVYYFYSKDCVNFSWFLILLPSSHLKEQWILLEDSLT